MKEQHENALSLTNSIKIELPHSVAVTKSKQDYSKCSAFILGTEICLFGEKCLVHWSTVQNTV